MLVLQQAQHNRSRFVNQSQSKGSVVLTLFLLLLTNIASAQSIRIEKLHDTTNITGDTLNLVLYDNHFKGWQSLNLELRLRNTSGKTMVIGAKKAEPSKINHAEHTFCFAANCYDVYTFTSPLYDTVKSGKEDSSFSAHLVFNDSVHIPGSFLVYYVFYDVENPSDSSVLYVVYNTSKIAGIKERNISYNFISNLYPNPANGFVCFSYEIKKPGLLEIKNTHGQTVKTIPLLKGMQTFSFNTSSLPDGIYFCCFGSGVIRKILVER